MTRDSELSTGDRPLNKLPLWLLAATCSVSLFGVVGCRPTVRVEPIQVEPIHIVVDVNIKVDRQLDEFFDFEDEMGVNDE